MQMQQKKLSGATPNVTLICKSGHISHQKAPFYSTKQAILSSNMACFVSSLPQG